MKELYKALAAFQAEVPNIYKNAKGYNYKFADLGGTLADRRFEDNVEEEDE